MKISNLLFKLKHLWYRFTRSGVHYIGGVNGLPAPLTSEEETAILLAKESGNKAAADQLVVHNLRLVVYIAKKFETSGVPVEDLVSIGTIGLIKAVNTYKSEKKIKLATYASRCIENEILMHLRKIASQRAELSIEEPLNVDWDGNELLLEDILGSDPDTVHKQLESEDEKKHLLHLVNQLSGREREIMIMRYGLMGEEEKTQKEVADALGISQSYISRLEKRILHKLRAQMEKIGI